VSGAGPAAASEDTLYRWVDGSGAVHFTQGLASVPEPYRRTATPLGSVGAPPPVPPPAAAPGPAPAPEPVPPPPVAPALPPVAPAPRPITPAPVGSPERNRVDDLLSSARTARQYLAAADGYLRLGLPLGARTAVAKAAAVARSAEEWRLVASAWAGLGDEAAAAQARKRAEQAAEWERVRGGPPSR
jgi:hypothetical protein